MSQYLIFGKIRFKGFLRQIEKNGLQRINFFVGNYHKVLYTQKIILRQSKFYGNVIIQKHYEVT